MVSGTVDMPTSVAPREPEGADFGRGLKAGSGDGEVDSFSSGNSFLLLLLLWRESGDVSSRPPFMSRIGARRLAGKQSAGSFGPVEGVESHES